MALVVKKFVKRTQDIRSIDYDANVPFHMACAVCEHTLDSNDDLAPQDPTEINPDYVHVPGYGAIYRLIGDGVHSPTFNTAFQKSSASGDYDNTLATVNLITFLFDGVDYWYNIVQPA